MRQYSRDSRVTREGDWYTVVIDRGSGLEQRLDALLASLGLELFDTDVLKRCPYEPVAMFGVHSATRGMPERTAQ